MHIVAVFHLIHTFSFIPRRFPYWLDAMIVEIEFSRHLRIPPQVFRTPFKQFLRVPTHWHWFVSVYGLYVDVSSSRLLYLRFICTDQIDDVLPRECEIEVRRVSLTCH